LAKGENGLRLAMYMGAIKNAHKDLVEKLVGKGPFGRTRRRWEEDVKKYS
jgi:hypothetical protein